MIIKNIKTKGFTLIELLVVMAVISILAAMSLFALQGARATARDARRKGDLESIAIALEIYKSDCHEYPVALNGGASLQDNCTGANVVYMEKVFQDPLGMDYRYFRLTTQTYNLCSTLEDSTAGAPSGCPPSCTGEPCRYKVNNP